MWTIETARETQAADFSEHVNSILDSQVPPRPPKVLRLGSVEAQWVQTEPGIAMIMTNGGSIDDRILAEGCLRHLLVAAGYKQARFTIDARKQVRHSDWDDIMAKAKRLIQSGNVQILRNGYNNIVAHVVGDHGDYNTEISRDDPDSRTITQWTCECPWDQYAFQRTRQWKKYEGRPCAHVLAAYWKSLATPIDEDVAPGQEGRPPTTAPAGTPRMFGPSAPAPSPAPGMMPGMGMPPGGGMPPEMAPGGAQMLPPGMIPGPGHIPGSIPGGIPSQQGLPTGQPAMTQITPSGLPGIPGLPPGQQTTMMPSQLPPYMMPPGQNPVIPPFPMEGMEEGEMAVSSPGGRPGPWPGDPIQNPAGTFSKVAAAGDAFTNADMVRLNEATYGIAEGKSDQHGSGQYQEIPKNSIGEVLGQDTTTGWVDCAFAGPCANNGPLEPYHIRAWIEPEKLTPMPNVPKPGPFIKRR